MVDSASALPGQQGDLHRADQPRGPRLAPAPRRRRSRAHLPRYGVLWGAEELYWQLPGVAATSVGYMGGFTAHPTYEEVCTGLTGHTETVFVAYRPAKSPPSTSSRSSGRTTIPPRATGKATTWTHTEARSSTRPRSRISRRGHAGFLRTGRCRTWLPGNHHRDRSGSRRDLLPGRGLPPAVPIQGSERIPVPREHRTRSASPISRLGIPAGLGG